MLYDYESETLPLLAENAEEATCRCGWCGRLYTERPFLCICQSNAFLRPINEQGVSCYTIMMN
jgi:hypothetical protein